MAVSGTAAGATAADRQWRRLTAGRSELLVQTKIESKSQIGETEIGEGLPGQACAGLSEEVWSLGP